MKCRLIAVGWLCVWMLSVNVNANVYGPDIDGDIAVWTDGSVIYWDDISDAKEPNQISSYISASSPTISGRTIMFEYGSTQDLVGFNIDDPSWQFPAGPNNTKKQRYPEISGPRVVWQDYTDPDTDPDIYMIDLTTSVITIVCDNAARQSSPSIDGDIVVWQDNRSGIYQIYWCNVAGDSYSPAPVNLTGFEQLAPAVSGDLIVWTEDRTEEGGQEDTGLDIYGYDLTQGQELPICTDLGDQTQPAVCGELIVWQDNNTTGGDLDICVYDRSTGQIQTVCGESGDQCYPAISSRTVVWQVGLTGTTVGYAILAEPTDITLISPEPNEMVLAGSQMVIDWNTEGPVEQVRIDYSTDAGATWNVVEPNVPAEMAYQWDLVADVDSTECQIRVSDCDNTDISDELDGTFTIFQCNETLTADVTGDCFVGLDDFAEMAAQWLTCGNPYDETWCNN